MKLHLLLTLIILSATLGAGAWIERRGPEVLARPLDSINSQIDGWTAKGNDTLGDTIVASLDATSYVSRTYRKGPDQLDMFTAFYAQQKAGESMHSPKYCLPGGGWEFSDFRTVQLPTEAGAVSINQATIQKPGSRALVFYWYQTRNRVVASEYQSKYFLVWDGLVHANPGGAIVRVLLSDRPGAQTDGLAFAAGLLQEVQRSFRTD